TATCPASPLEPWPRAYTAIHPMLGRADGGWVTKPAAAASAYHCHASRDQRTWWSPARWPSLTTNQVHCPHGQDDASGSPVGGVHGTSGFHGTSRGWLVH